jgi:hypothetical protein
MSDNEACLLKSPARAPWNKGKLTGAKPRCDPNTSGRVGRSSRSKAALATSQCSIWQSTVSFEGVMSSLSGSRMSPPAATRRIAQPSDKRRPGGQSDLN